MDYKPTIGLEIHAELQTKTKMFCACKNDTNEKRPNMNICPICLGHPGTLPVINKEAVKQVLKVGVALGGKLADDSTFDRKNYFYPDIPKGYQISQYKQPLVAGGKLNDINITRVHLEEDTARSSHIGDYSLVDFNRAGVPLMELVTEPEMHSGAEVAKFGKELRTLLQYLDVSFADMEKGEMRLEANVSVSDSDKLGTKVEIKNLNSFNSADRGVEFEIKRQIALLEKGEKVIQETRGWDENRQETFSQRAKEDSHDYRYFPDPDLPKLKLSTAKDLNDQLLRSELKETPAEKRNRFKKDYNIKDSDIEFYILNVAPATLFEEATRFMLDKKDFQLLSNYIVSDLSSLGKMGLVINAKYLADLIAMLVSGQISSRGAKDILNKMAENKEDPKTIAEKEDLFQKSNKEDLLKIANDIITQNREVVLEYKNGKISALQFLIGQGMKATQGSANPQTLKTIFEELIAK